METKPAPDKSPLRAWNFTPQEWFNFLLMGYHASGDVARPVRDCTGQLVKLEADGCADDPIPASVGPPPLTSRDLIFAGSGEGQRLIWAITDRLPDGQAQGPVALTEIEDRRVVVRAMGVLRAYPENVSLRLDKLAGGTVLVAEGERCVKPQVPELCQRAIRVVPLIKDHFVPKPLVDDKGTCVGSAFLSTRTGGGGSNRHNAKYSLEATVTFSPDNIAIREQLAITRAPTSSDAPDESFVTRVQAERQVTLRGESLVATSPSVLDRWLAQQSSSRK